MASDPERLFIPGPLPGAEDAIAAKRRELEAQRAREQLPPPAVPPRFERTRLEHYRPENPSQRVALQLVGGWVDQVVAGETPMLALIGPTGIGKSHLAFGAAWALYELHRIRAHVVEWYAFVDALRYGTGPRDERGQPMVRSWEARQAWWEARISIVDEARRTSGTDFDATELARYAQHCYAHGVAVLLTTNEPSLAEAMDEPAADRFTQHVMVGRSQR